MALIDRLRKLTAADDKSPHHALFTKHGFSSTGTGYEPGSMRHRYFAVPSTHDKRPMPERVVGLRRDLKAKGYVQQRKGDARKWTHKKGDSIHYFDGQLMHLVPKK